MALLIAPTAPTSTVILFLAAAIGALVVSTRRPIERAALLILLIGALATRYEIRTRVGSDVLDVTAAAIDRVLAGLNPYGVGYEQSRPPGSPFPYGPLAILWYVPVQHLPRLAELLSASHRRLDARPPGTVPRPRDLRGHGGPREHERRRLE